MRRIYYWNYTFNYNGFIIPYVGIILNKSVKGTKGEPYLIRHEEVHYNQFKRTGALIYIFLYLLDILYHGYDLSLFEIEARYEETKFTQYNYTYSVRKGIAKTAFNPNFRKGKKIKRFN